MDGVLRWTRMVTAVAWAAGLVAMVPVLLNMNRPAAAITTLAGAQLLMMWLVLDDLFTNARAGVIRGLKVLALVVFWAAAATWMSAAGG